MVRDIRSELKIAKPFGSVAHEAHLTLARTAAVVEHQLEEAFRAHGITSTQFNVLRILRGAGTDGLCRAEVGERMVRRVPDVTRLLDRLEASKLIVRQRIGDDRRYVTARITPKGLALLDEIDPTISALEEKLLEHVSPARLKELIKILNEVRAPG
jgi:DNA-binding MarR family transcriptional regulator